MLLEEAVLHRLRHSGYQPIYSPGRDETLEMGPAGLKVKGRGCWHQVDAVADFEVRHPFGYPQRILVEAKCFAPREKVGLDIVRSAVGVLKDVSEHWRGGRGPTIPKERYHYQYAIFSATGYSSDAQRYAYAQDIYLIPLAESAFIQPIIQAIRAVGAGTDAREDLELDMTALRQITRVKLQGHGGQFPLTLNGTNVRDALDRFIGQCNQIQFALLVVLGTHFPVFLVPNPIYFRNRRLEDIYYVRIYRGDGDVTWYVRARSRPENLFSFDLPKQLFLLYARQHKLTAAAAIDMKQREMSEFQAFYRDGDRIQLITFRLDDRWLNEIRARI